ncbi:MAG: vitamin K epoxide reductase family protein [Verrucomicrobiota bacterium]|nr:vitamin K epoxide reductase family protein [Verrucomicrobiota bacterium]
MTTDQPQGSSGNANGSDRVRTIIYSLAAIIALAGLAESVYLTVMHLSGANVVCVASNGCSEVLHSAYASLHGIPLAALGGLAYFCVFSAALLAAFGRRAAETFLALIVGIMFLTTLALLYIQARVLHNFCDYCLLSAAMIFLLAGLVIATPRRS